jgi:hypothetical protein
MLAYRPDMRGLVTTLLAVLLLSLRTGANGDRPEVIHGKLTVERRLVEPLPWSLGGRKLPISARSIVPGGG